MILYDIKTKTSFFLSKCLKMLLGLFMYKIYCAIVNKKITKFTFNDMLIFFFFINQFLKFKIHLKLKEYSNFHSIHYNHLFYKHFSVTSIIIFYLEQSIALYNKQIMKIAYDFHRPYSARRYVFYALYMCIHIIYYAVCIILYST